MTNGAAGLLQTLQNVGSFPITLTNEDASSTAANRFHFSGNAVLPAGAAITLWYDATLSRWVPRDAGQSFAISGGMVLGGFVAVDFNSANTDFAIPITSPTTNYFIDEIVVVNTGATASLTVARAGVFTAAAGGGTAVSVDAALAGITSNAASTASSATALGAPASPAVTRAYYNAGTLFFRVSTAQGAAATGKVYVFIRPLP